MRVYILAFGEHGEGHVPASVWASLDEAMAEAERTYGVRPVHMGGVQWRATLPQTSGVDEVRITIFIVRGGGA